MFSGVTGSARSTLSAAIVAANPYASKLPALAPPVVAATQLVATKALAPRPAVLKTGFWLAVASGEAVINFLLVS